MQRPITPTMHGVLDYATVLTTAAAPRALGFAPAATRACDALAAGYLGLSMVTDYPLAVRPMVPFKLHGAAEVASVFLIPTLPWVLGFAEDRRARNFFLGLTAVTVVVASLTDWDAR